MVSRHSKHGWQAQQVGSIVYATGVSRGVVREILNHRLCVAHPNIVQFREIFLTPQHLAIVMEFAAGGDMFEYVIKNKGSGPGEGLKEDVARHFFQQLILALDFCQKLGIANRCAQSSSEHMPASLTVCIHSMSSKGESCSLSCDVAASAY